MAVDLETEQADQLPVFMIGGAAAYGGSVVRRSRTPARPRED